MAHYLLDTQLEYNFLKREYGEVTPETKTLNPNYRVMKAGTDEVVQELGKLEKDGKITDKDVVGVLNKVIRKCDEMRKNTR